MNHENAVSEVENAKETIRLLPPESPKTKILLHKANPTWIPLIKHWKM